jgi:hypothetical protein
VSGQTVKPASGVTWSGWQEQVEGLLLAMPDLGTHATFLATKFSSPFSSFFGSHLFFSPERQMCPATNVQNQPDFRAGSRKPDMIANFVRTRQ